MVNQQFKAESPKADLGAESQFPSEPPVAQVPGGPEEENLIGTIVAGRYFVKRVLGHGGMGAVYEAEHVQLKKRVALKVLHGHMSAKAEVQARFEREAVAAGRINHPGVVAATDFGRLLDGSFYLVLEHVDGASLSEVLTETPVLPPARAFRICAQICAALAAAHAQGIVHRDLKPDNIMLVSPGDEDIVKVLDFGIAMVQGDEATEERPRITRAGLVFGTPEYMSPEQARGAMVDLRSDLYSLGMITYEMLCGRSAFRADDLMAMLTAQMADPPPPLPRSVPAPLAQLVLSCLEKDPASRPQTAQALLSRLRVVAATLGYVMPAPRAAGASRASAWGISPTFAAATSAFNSIRALSLRPPGAKSLPGWAPALALIVGLAGGAFLVINGSARVRNILGVSFASQKRPLPSPAPTLGNPADAGEEQLLVEARQGERDKVAELRKLVERDRAAAEAAVHAPSPDAHDSGPATKASTDLVARQVLRLLALGRGYSVILHYSGALSAYQDAVRLDPHVAEDSDLLVDVRALLAQRDAVEEGLDFARALGALGSDMIYDLLSDHRGQAGMTPVVSRAEKLLKSGEVRQYATSALLVALDLDKAKVCAEYKQVLPRAVLFADVRSLPKLKALRLTQGCGTTAKADCFPCLRDEEAPLEAAIHAASTRPEPPFLAAAAAAR